MLDASAGWAAGAAAGTADDAEVSVALGRGTLTIERGKLKQPSVSADMRNSWSTGLGCDDDVFLFVPCTMQPTASASRMPSSMSFTVSASVKYCSISGKVRVSSAVSGGVS